MPSYLVKGASSEEFKEKLNQAAKRSLTAKEQLEQKVSFIYSSIKTDGLTKEKIRDVLQAHEA
jgi:hypothetical protein